MNRKPRLIDCTFDTWPHIPKLEPLPAQMGLVVAGQAGGFDFGCSSCLAFGFKLYLSILHCRLCDLLFSHAGGVQGVRRLGVSKDFY